MNCFFCDADEIEDIGNGKYRCKKCKIRFVIEKKNLILTNSEGVKTCHKSESTA